MSDQAHDDDQIMIERYERTIANLEQEAKQWKAPHDELLRIYNERPEMLEVQKLQAALDTLRSLQQEDETQLSEARALLEEVEMLLSSDDGDFRAWLNDYAAFTEKYPQETDE